MGVRLHHVFTLHIFLSIPQALADGKGFSNRVCSAQLEALTAPEVCGAWRWGRALLALRLLLTKGGMLYWICTTHCTETKPFSICSRKVTNCHMSLCCAYVKWAQPITFAHSLCDLLSHTMSALLSPVLMLCNLLCRSAAGSSPLRIIAHFAT